MSKFFSLDSPAARFLSRAWDLFLLNLLFLLGALPVLTLGVSASAAYAVALRLVEDREEGVARAFFRAYRENLRQGLPLTLLYFALGAAVAADFMLFEAVEGNPIGFLILGMLSAGLVLVHFFYVFALAARYQNTLFRHLTNARRIFFRFFGRSLLCCALVALEIWLFFFNGYLLLFIGVFVAPALVILTKSAFAIKLFRTLEAQNERAANAAAAQEPEGGGADGNPSDKEAQP